MSDDQQQTFHGPRSIGPCPEVWREPSFGAAEDALCLPALTIFLGGKATLQAAAVTTAGRILRVRPGVDRNNCLPNPPRFPTAPMVFFRVVASVAQQTPDTYPADRLFHGGQEGRRVIARPSTEHRRQDEMTAMVDNGSKLGPPAMSRGASFPAAAIEKVPTDIMIFQSRGIDAGFTGGPKQAELSSEFDDFS